MMGSVLFGVEDDLSDFAVFERASASPWRMTVTSTTPT
jgi:hypothetical protein